MAIENFTPVASRTSVAASTNSSHVQTLSSNVVG